MDERLGLPQGAFTKIDAEEDELFYEPPRRSATSTTARSRR